MQAISIAENESGVFIYLDKSALRKETVKQTISVLDKQLYTLAQHSIGYEVAEPAKQTQTLPNALPTTPEPFFIPHKGAWNDDAHGTYSRETLYEGTGRG
jgi:hypothetical protein